MKKIISCTFFVVFFIIALFQVSKCLEYKGARTKYASFYNSETDYDVIFLGSSHAYNSIFPQELWKEYGITSYNWGYSNCTLAEDYYIVQEVLKYTSPKLIVVDLYGLVEYEQYNNGKYRSDRIEQQHIQFDAMPLSLNKIRASQDIFDDYSGNLDFIFNFIMYHNRWNELSEGDFNVGSSAEKGASFLTGLGRDVEFKLLDKNEKEKIDSVCYEYLLKLLDFCSNENIQLLCVYLPYPANDTNQKIANTVGDVINEYTNCKYINMLDKNILNLATDVYVDGSHLNYTGGVKATSWLGSYIKETYNIEDHSKDKEYSLSWNEDYEKYLQLRINNICNHDNFYEKLLLLYGMEFNVLIEVAEDSDFFNDIIIAEFINGLGDNCVVNIKKDVEYNGTSCDMKLIIKRNDNQEVIDTRGYIFQNEIISFAE